MADIKQAAKWMQEGKIVIRPHNVGIDERYFAINGDGDSNPESCFVRFCDSREDVNFTVGDLLADDWEIANE